MFLEQNDLEQVLLNDVDSYTDSIYSTTQNIHQPFIKAQDNDDVVTNHSDDDKFIV